jgi:short-subunit dehydrogenase
MKSIEKHSEQQRSLVTGATSGIGLAFSKELAKQNRPVVVVARNAAKLKEVYYELAMVKTKLVQS